MSDSKRKYPPDFEPSAEVAAEMAARAQDIASQGKKNGRELDFSEASVAELQEFALRMWSLGQRIFSGDELDTYRENLFVCTAAYVGEVLRRQGWEWGWSLVPGVDRQVAILSPSGRVTGHPLAKVQKRLEGNEADDFDRFADILKLMDSWPTP